MSELTVIIPTFNRPEILASTVYLLHQNLYLDGVSSGHMETRQIQVLIGNDGDPIDLPDVLFNLTPPFVKILQGPRRGLGANLNMLLRAAPTDVVLQMDDDHHLVKPLDITQYVKDLEERRYDIGWVRLFLGTEEDLNNDDPFYRFVGHMQERYWVLDSRAPELYIASNRSHLKLKAFHRPEMYGMYAEGLSLGETESEFCHRYKDRHRKLRESSMWSLAVAMPVAAPSFDTWEHVGESWQKQGL